MTRLQKLINQYATTRAANAEAFTHHTTATDINDFLEWYIDHDLDEASDMESTMTDVLDRILDMEKK